MSNETCPHCGAEGKKVQNIFRHEIRYACGSMGDLEPVFRFFPSDYCYERQLAAKDAEIERLEFEAAVGRKLTELLRSGATITGSPDCLTKDVAGGINGKLVIKYPEGEVK